MASGLRTRNPDGSIQLDTTTRMYRVLTVELAGGNDGSYTSAELATGDPIVGVDGTEDDKIVPSVSVSGNTVSWSYGGAPSGNRDTGSHVTIAVF